MVACSVPGCANRSETVPTEITFHRLPRSEARRQEYCTILKMNAANLTQGSRICSEHFSKSSIYITKKNNTNIVKDALPIPFPPVVNTNWEAGVYFIDPSLMEDDEALTTTTTVTPLSSDFPQKTLSQPSTSVNSTQVCVEMAYNEPEYGKFPDGKPIAGSEVVTATPLSSEFPQKTLFQPATSETSSQVCHMVYNEPEHSKFPNEKSAVGSEVVTATSVVTPLSSDSPQKTQPSTCEKGTQVCPYFVYNDPEKQRLRDRLSYVQNDYAKQLKAAKRQIRDKDNQLARLREILDRHAKNKLMREEEEDDYWK